MISASTAAGPAALRGEPDGIKPEEQAHGTIAT